MQWFKLTTVVHRVEAIVGQDAALRDLRAALVGRQLPQHATLLGLRKPQLLRKLKAVSATPACPRACLPLAIGLVGPLDLPLYARDPLPPETVETTAGY